MSARRIQAAGERTEPAFVFCMLNGRAGQLHDAPFFEAFTTSEGGAPRICGRYLPLRYRLLICGCHGLSGPVADYFTSFSLS